MTRDVFVGDQVHTVTGGGDQTNVTYGVQGDQLFEGDGLVHEMDGDELHGTELAVDSADQLVDHRPQVLVLFHVPTTGHCDLHEDNLAPPLRMLAQKHLHGVQLLRDTLDVIQSVDTDYDLAALEGLLQLLDSLLDGVLLQPVGELVHVDTDGEGPHVNEPALVLYPVGQRVHVENPLHGGEEMSCVVVGVEPDQVTTQDPLQDLLPDGQDSVDFTGWERRVQEPPDLDVLQVLFLDLDPQHLRDQHQMVVVHPDQVVVVHDLGNLVGERLVGLVVRQPRILVEIDLARVVMEQRPQDRVAEPVVVQVRDLVGQENGHRVELLQQILLHLLLLVVRDLQPGPSEPLKSICLLQPLQRRHQPSGRHRVLVLARAAVLADGHGQSIRNHNDIAP